MCHVSLYTALMEHVEHTCFLMSLIQSKVARILGFLMHLKSLAHFYIKDTELYVTIGNIHSESVIFIELMGIQYA